MTDERDSLAEEVPPPSPEGSGSDGDQAASPPGSTAVVPVRPVELDDSHLGATLTDIGPSRSPAVQAVTVALYRTGQQALSDVMGKWSQAEEEKSDLRTRLSQAEQTVAVLRERLRLSPRMTRVQNLGGILLGAGFGIAYSERTLLGLGGALVLVGLLLFGFGRPLKGDDPS